MEIENKLDEDFLFYLGFMNSSFNNLNNQGDIERCEQWLHKLVGETCTGVDLKRARNIYLSNLVLCMQDGELSDPFRQSPYEVDISNALEVFGPVITNIQEPPWLKEVVDGGGEERYASEGPTGDGGRTYLATRTLPGGAGAFAYLAVSLAEQEPKWLGGGEGIFDLHMQEKFKEFVPPITEMEKILAKRKDPKERERVLLFYDALITNIEDELDGKIEPAKNDTVNGLLNQMTEDMGRRGQYGQFEQMPERQRRPELLVQLHGRVKARRDKVAKREEYLDDIAAQQMPESFFHISLDEQDKFEIPTTMWEQAINKAPNKKNMTLLQENYPISVIEKFMELLSNHKEEIALRMQRRHENIMSQMKKELRQEGEKGKRKMEEVQSAFSHINGILQAVRLARTKQKESEQRALDKMTLPVPEHSKMYNEMRAALYETQRSVEEEAALGQQLAAQINLVNEQTEMYMQVNLESVQKTEEANMAIMKNIKRLRGAVRQHEIRLQHLQELTKRAGEGAGSDAQTMMIL